MKSIARKYIDFLSVGNTEGIIQLFAKNGKVHSPIYGEKPAQQFYNELEADTNTSELRLKRIFEDPASNSLALYFEYKWTVKSGKLVVFDVVDIIEFNEANKITFLKIIYDTVVSRRLVEELNH